MTLHRDIIDLQKHLGEMHSIGDMRAHLIRRELRLIVSIYTRGVHCLEWDITDKKVVGILDLGFRIRISKLTDSIVLLETRSLCSVRFDQTDWIDQKNLFETLKRGIKSCIRND